VRPFVDKCLAGRCADAILNGGELAIMFSFVFLFLSAAGGGAWSVDSVRGSSAG